MKSRIALIISLVAAIALSACAVTGSLLGNSPEAQIKTGYDSHKLASTLGMTLLKNGKVTAQQSRGYSNILNPLIAHLDDANKTLLDCRAKTKSTQRTVPDPCAAGIEADIRLAVSGISEVQRTLKAKE